MESPDARRQRVHREVQLKNRLRLSAIGGYTPGGSGFDAVLVGYYEGGKLIFAASIRAGFTPSLRDGVFRRFTGLEVEQCPFVNLPDVHKGRWGQGLTAADMLKCRWLKPRLVAAIKFLEWTPVDYGTRGLSQ